MNNLWELWSHWLVRPSWQAGILVLVVLAAQRLFRNRLTAAWRHALWFLVVLKLALPWGPSSPLSLFNLTSHSPRSAALVDAQSVQDSVPAKVTLLERSNPSASPDRGRLKDFSAAGRLGFTLLWLLGMIILAVRLIWQTTHFGRLVGEAPLVSNPEVLAAFEACRDNLGIRRSVRLVQTDLIRSPAVFGYFRPTLLLPEQVARSFSPAELRHVFLHELSHVKRHDVLVLWVVGLLRILHWVNPVLWFGFNRMAADRELACDELVLAHSPGDEPRAYGNTILRVLQNCAQPTMEVSAVGILEDRSQVIQRIARIVDYKKPSPFSRAGILLLAGLAVFTLTDPKEPAQAQPATSTPIPAQAVPSQSAPGTQPTPAMNGELEQLKSSYSELGARIDELQDQLRELRQKYTENHPKVLALRSELEQLDHQQAAIGERLRAEEDRATALEAFRKRYGLVPGAAQAAPTNPESMKAREAFRRRYGLPPEPASPAQTTSNGGSEVKEPDMSLGRYGQGYAFVPRLGTNSAELRTNSAAQARAAFLKRYGFSDSAGAQPNPATRSSGAREFQTALSNKNLPLRIQIDAQGNLRLGSERKFVPLEQVQTQLADEVKRNPNLRLSIRADKNAPFGQVIKVMDAAKDAKITGVDASVDQSGD